MSRRLVDAIVDACLTEHGAATFAALPPRARERLFAAAASRYRPYLRAVARRYLAGVDPESSHLVTAQDLEAAALTGLQAALESFDPGRSASFSRYADWRVRWAVLEELKRQDAAPRRLRDKERKLAKARRSLRAALGREPGPDELAVAMDLSEEDLGRLLREVAFSIPTFVPDPEDNPDTGPGPEDHCLAHEVNAALDSCLGLLPPRAERILRLYFGQGLTLKEVGAKLELSEQRVSQLKDAALGGLGAVLRRRLAPEDCRATYRA